MKLCENCHRTFPGTVVYCPFDGVTLDLVVHPDCNQDPLMGHLFVGTYRIIEKLNQGGFGSVYRATHLRTQQDWAIKILNPNFSSHRQVVRRFQREAEVVSQLKHPHILTVIDFGISEEGYAFMVMELLQGETLRDLLRREKRLSCERMFELCLEIAQGVDAAHAKGILHRDLKPENVMLVPDHAGRLIVKLVDFGIAKLIESNETLTAPNMIIGTPQYISPEQCRGEKLGFQSDIYSLGIMAFEMLVGKTPFVPENREPSNAKSLLLRQVAEIPKPPSLWVRDVSPLMDQVILRALEKNPSNRFETVMHFVNEMRTAIKPIMPAPTSLMGQSPDSHPIDCYPVSASNKSGTLPFLNDSRLKAGTPPYAGFSQAPRSFLPKTSPILGIKLPVSSPKPVSVGRNSGRLQYLMNVWVSNRQALHWFLCFIALAATAAFLIGYMIG